MTYPVRIHYRSWNEACIWAMEQFGLPAEKTFQTSFGKESLTFSFANEQDAILFALHWL